MSFYCESAWSPPVEAFEHISKQYPELTFKLEFYEDGCCFMGIVVLRNGEILEEREGDPNNPEDREDFDFAPEPYEGEDEE